MVIEQKRCCEASAQTSFYPNYGLPETPVRDKNGCCWSRSKSMSKNLKPNDTFHYYGIPLLSPTDYYRFLNAPHSENHTDHSTLEPNTRQSPIKTVVLATSKESQNKFSINDVFKFNGSLRRQRKTSNKNNALPVPETKKNFFSSAASSSKIKQDNVNGEPLYGLITVTLWRRNGVQLGLGITGKMIGILFIILGGSDRPIPPTISYLRPGFIAHRCDQLQVGDRLGKVNGVSVENLTHQEIMILLRNAGPLVTLQIEYDLKSAFFHSAPSNTWQKCAEICLENDSDNSEEIDLKHNRTFVATSGMYGITLRGGAYGPDPAKNRPITITSIRPGGPAHREGRLRVGDRILSIEGVDITNATLPNALKLIKESKHKIHLTVEYDASILSKVGNTKGPMLLEIEKIPGVDFGMVLSIKKLKRNSSINNKKIILQEKFQFVTIEEIIPASVADRCGAVHVGDEICAIDGISLEYTTLSEIYQLLQSQSNFLRLELLPSSQINAIYESPDCKKQRPDSFHPLEQHKELINGGRLLSRNLSPKNLVDKHEQFSKANLTKPAHSPVYSTIIKRKKLPNSIIKNNQNLNEKLNKTNAKSRLVKGSNGSMSAHFEGVSGIPCTQISHAETMEITLTQKENLNSSYDFDSYGITLERANTSAMFNHRHRGQVEYNDENNDFPQILYISSIARNSPADR